MLSGGVIVTKVIALVGPSGTGKSHRALKIAYETNSSLIIDDGLLIQDGRIIAGISSKKQPTKIGAIKTALFTDLKHRTQAQEAIAKISAKQILVLGTSWEMVVIITQRLHLTLPDQLVNIEDVSTPEDIKKAHYNRNKLGKHVIPAPTLEVKKTFPNTLIHSLKVKLTHKDSTQQIIAEQSIIRPTYSSLGHFTIAEKVLSDIARKIANDFEGVHLVKNVSITSGQGNAIIDIEYVAIYGYNLPLLSREIQMRVKESVEHQTGLNITAVNLLVLYALGSIS
ncbi:hypothetical protein CEB3_c47070 [Peptococcaceae bacterium CEB3]|nr:hypothetical protein CEB3_c47070 [Peptococcaceae bacterium CEB3]